jgi:predicted enzyme related to lactoylglutathione lyase
MAGKIVHVEIPAGDTSRAREFYGGLFGWQFQSFEGSPTEYLTTQIDETSGAAIYVPDPANRRGTRTYFDVDDARAGAAQVKELGGEAQEPLPVPGLGWFVVCKDPEGNEFGLWQTDPDATPPTA